MDWHRPTAAEVAARDERWAREDAELAAAEADRQAAERGQEQDALVDKVVEALRRDAFAERVRLAKSCMVRARLDRRRIGR
jgi:F0F1-type ATP synthase membrane subunit b/b'